MQAIELENQARAPDARIGPPMEHRFGRRHRCGAHVQIGTAGGLDGAGRLVNVSMSGAYIQTTLQLALLAPISVTKMRKADHQPVELHASVVRRDADGVGIEWSETPACSICDLLGCPQPCDAS